MCGSRDPAFHAGSPLQIRFPLSTHDETEPKRGTKGGGRNSSRVDQPKGERQQRASPPHRCPSPQRCKHARLGGARGFVSSSFLCAPCQNRSQPTQMETSPPPSPPLSPTAAPAAASSSSSAAVVCSPKTSTFLEHFGLDRLNDALTPLLNEQRKAQDRFGQKWKTHAWEVPNPAPGIHSASVASVSSPNSARGSPSPASPIPSVQLSTAQEAKFHFRTHALSPAAAKRKRERRERLLAQQRHAGEQQDNAPAQLIDAQPVQPAYKPGSSSSEPGESALLRSMSAGARRQIELARTASRSRSSSRPTSPLALSARSTDGSSPRALSSEERVAWANYSEFLGRERVQIESEMQGLSVQDLQQKLQEEQKVLADAERQIREEEGSEDSGDEGEGEQGSRSSSPRGSAGGREHGPASFGLLSRRRRLPGATPQQFFLSHGHDRLYAGAVASSDLSRIARQVKPPHKDLADKLQSRASKSMVGVRYDTIYWIERESERKWLAAHLRQQQIQKAIATIQSMGSSQHATAALAGLVEATKRAVEPRDEEPMRPASAAALRRAALPTPTPPVTVPSSRTRSPSPAPPPPPPPPPAPTTQFSPAPHRSDSAPNFYPPSASAQLGMSANGSQILSEQLPHLAGLVVAAEERSDPYGDMYHPSAVETSMAAAAAAAAGLAIPPPPPRRIQGAPTLVPRPPTRPSLIGPDSTENAVNPEPHLSAFRVSKRGVVQSAKAIAAYPGREIQTPRGVSEFGSRPATAEINATQPAVAAASRPDTAPTAPSPETARTSASTPFADTLHFPPQRYPPSAPTLSAVCALTPLSAIEQSHPFQPNTPVSFKHRIKVTPHMALRPSLSVWPDATMANQPLPFNIRAAKPSALSSDATVGEEQGEPELVHIRPWAPRPDLHSSQLAHCVPRPPSSLLGASRSAQFTPPVPPVRSGSATARARGESASARRRKSAASSGSSTARPSRISSAHMVQPEAPSPPTEANLQETGEFPVHVAVDAGEAGAASSLEPSVAPTHPKMSSAPLSPTAAAGRSSARLVSPARSPLAGGSPSARSPARSPRHALLESVVDTLALKPEVDVSTLVQTGLNSPPSELLPSSDSAMDFAALPLLEDGVSAWASLPTPPSSRPASRVKREKRRKSSKRRKSNPAGQAGGATSPSSSISPRRASGEKPHSPGRQALNKPNPARGVGKPPVAVAAEIPEFVPQAYMDASVRVRIPSHAFSASYSFDPSSADMLAAMKADAVFDPTLLQHPMASPAPPEVTRSPRLEKPQTSSMQPPRSAPSRRPSTRYYGHDANGFPRSGDVSPQPGGCSDDGRASSLSPRSSLRASTEVPNTHLFKPSLNFKTHASWRNREVGDEVARPTHTTHRSISSSSASKRPQKLGAFEEATLRRHEPSTRWQLIDQEFKDQRVDVHAVERIKLARITSERGLVDHLGTPLPDQKLSHYERTESQGPLKAHGADSASEDSETDAELALLSKEEKENRWAARVAKQERRLQAQQAEIDRRIRDALDEEELQDELDDNVVAAAERTRRRRARLARAGSLTVEEKAMAEQLDLDQESRALQDRMAEFVAVESPQDTGLIHQANKIMRKEEREAKVRDQAWESGEATSHQRRATAFPALDDGTEQETESTVDESVSHGRKRSHGRQVSVSTFDFDDVKRAPAPKEAGSSVPEVHPITASSAPSVQDPQLFRRKTGERAKAVSAKHAHALLATVSEGRGSRAVRNKKLATSMRTQTTLAHARKQLATSEQLHRLMSPEENLAHLSQQLSAATEEMKVNDAAAPPVPGLNLVGLTARSSTSSGTARRTDSTLFNATGFATWSASSPLGLSRPATALAAATPWQIARLERHARREAQLSARQWDNAARVNATEQDRLSHIDLALSARAEALASERHFSLDLVPRVSNLHAAALGGSAARPAVYVSQPHVPSAVVAPSQLLDKSVTHPLQRVKLMSHSSQRWSERQQHVIAMAAKLAQQEWRDSMRAAKAESVYFRS